LNAHNELEFFASCECCSSGFLSMAKRY